MALIQAQSQQQQQQSKDQQQLTLRSSLMSQPRFTLTGHREPVLTCAMSSNAQIIASASIDGKVFIWSATQQVQKRGSFSCVASYSMKAAVTRIRFASGDTLVVCSLASGTVAVINIEKGEVLRPLRPPRPEKVMLQNAIVINDVAVASAAVNDSIVASCGDDGRVCIFDVRVANPNVGCKTFACNTPLTAVAFAKSRSSGVDENLFCGGVDGCLRWLQRSGSDLKCVVECQDAHDDVICGIDTCASTSPGTVLSYSFAGSLRVHDLRPKQNVADRSPILFEDTIARPDGVIDRSLLRCAFSLPSGQSIVAATVNGNVALYSNWQATPESQQRQRWFVAPHKAAVTDVCFHPAADSVGETVFLSSSIDGTMVLAAA